MSQRLHISVIASAAALLAVQTAVAADLIAPPPSPPVPSAPVTRQPLFGPWSGFVDAAIAYGKGETDNIETDGLIWSVRGAANYAFDNGINIQIDGVYESAHADPHDVQAFTGMAHLYYRQPERYALGVFLQTSRYEPNSPNLIGTVLEGSYLLDLAAGGELAYYAGPVTLFGRIGWDLAKLSGVEADHFLASAGARYYFTDNIRLDIDGQLDHVGALGGDLKLYSISAVGNYRFDQAPVTMFGGYAYHHGEVEHTAIGNEKGSAHTFLVGLRLHFGSDSLKDEERTGPAWALASQLP